MMKNAYGVSKYHSILTMHIHLHFISQSYITPSIKSYVVYGDGKSEARFDKELSLQEGFFHIQDFALKTFQLALTTNKSMEIRGKLVIGSGYTETAIRINQPPTSGNCFFKAYDDIKDTWYETSAGVALIQTFKLACDDQWVDPDQHRIVKYAFKCNIMLHTLYIKSIVILI